MIEVRRYVARSGSDVIGDWLTSLGGPESTGKDCGATRSVISGNFGDCKALREGVSELRIDWGPAYRVYYAMLGRTCVLLLCGGDKRRQASDIKRAIEYLEDFKERTRRK